MRIEVVYGRSCKDTVPENRLRWFVVLEPPGIIGSPGFPGDNRRATVTGFRLGTFGEELPREESLNRTYKSAHVLIASRRLDVEMHERA